MLIVDTHWINDSPISTLYRWITSKNVATMAFPTMKPLESERKVLKENKPVEKVEEKIDFSNVVIEPLLLIFFKF